MADATIQTIVIGAGVVGLACAAALARDGHEVIVLERETAIGCGVSSRNSEVIHAGIYYPAGSLRAALCVEGKQRLYRHCQQYHVAASAVGKLIVATSDDEIATLEQLAARAVANGVNDLQFLSANEATTMQPGLHCRAALLSPSTGIVDSHQLMLSLQGQIESAGGLLALATTVTSIDCTSTPYHVTTCSASQQMTLQASEIINCAGLDAVALADSTQGLPPSSVPCARFARGNYFRLQGRAPFTKLIYPAPVAGGLGVHLTLDHSGQARFGPDVQFLPDTHPPDSGFDYQVDPQRADSFYSAIRRYWPALPDNSLIPDYSGVRPKISRTEQPEVDFEISTANHHGIPGLVNLYGIESPGLTSSLAIAERVCQALR